MPAADLQPTVIIREATVHHADRGVLIRERDGRYELRQTGRRRDDSFPADVQAPDTGGQAPFATYQAGLNAATRLLTVLTEQDALEDAAAEQVRAARQERHALARQEAVRLTRPRQQVSKPADPAVLPAANSATDPAALPVSEPAPPTGPTSPEGTAT